MVEVNITYLLFGIFTKYYYVLFGIFMKEQRSGATHRPHMNSQVDTSAEPTPVQSPLSPHLASPVGGWAVETLVVVVLAVGGGISLRYELKYAKEQSTDIPKLDLICIYPRSQNCHHLTSCDAFIWQVSSEIHLLDHFNNPSADINTDDVFNTRTLVQQESFTPPPDFLGIPKIKVELSCRA